jgi:energy-coupling factor transport system permease protein
VLHATVQDALDRALDVAAVLEMRGYGSAGRSRRGGHPRSRHDIAFACAAAGVLAIVIAARVSGAADFTAYPLVSMAGGPATILAALALVAVALAPFADRRGIEP